MSKNVSEQPVEDVSGGGSEEGVDEEALAAESSDEGLLSGGPRVTFRGNAYDLVSLGSLATGALILFSCLTCNTGYYCFPLIPLALGAIGLFQSHQAVEEERTRRWSWIGIAAGGSILLLVALCIVLYIGVFALAIVADQFQ